MLSDFSIMCRWKVCEVLGKKQSSTPASFCDGWGTMWLKSMDMVIWTQFLPFGSHRGMRGREQGADNSSSLCFLPSCLLTSTWARLVSLLYFKLSLYQVWPLLWSNFSFLKISKAVGCFLFPLWRGSEKKESFLWGLMVRIQENINGNRSI